MSSPIKSKSAWLVAILVSFAAAGTHAGDFCPDADSDGFLACECPPDNVRGTEPCDCSDVRGNGCDCDDDDPEVNPDELESCNGVDDNCDGSTDEGFGLGDPCGTGPCAGGVIECEPGGGAAQCSTEFGGSNDQSAPEACDGIDNDCDGQLPPDEEDADSDGLSTCDGDCNDSNPAVTLPDTDSDGWDDCACLGGPAACDCDDTDPNIGPFEIETCSGVDDNCDGSTDEGFGVGDDCGTGDCAGGVIECASAETTQCSTESGGSNDLTSPEACDGIDNDCDGQLPPDEQDADSDGLSTCDGDCNDFNPNVTLPDTDSDGSTDCACFEGGGGRAPCDCDDTDPNNYPGNTEICDGQDNNCDLSTDEGLGSITCGTGECEATVDACVGGSPQSCTPGASTDETCDGLDNDCDGSTDETCGACCLSDGTCLDSLTQAECEAQSGEAQGQGTFCEPECLRWFCDARGDGVVCCTDIDADGVTTCGGDCDDNDPNNFPGNTETCDGQDNNCDLSTDEGLGSITCGTGECEATVDACVGGSPQSCTPGTPTDETCDGLDNDCDTSTDETCGACCQTDGTCLDNLTQAECVAQGGETQGEGTFCELPCRGRSCFPPPGAVVCCTDIDADGVTTCQGDCDDLDANNFPGNAEICDRQDNDCDGAIDEDDVCVISVFVDIKPGSCPNSFNRSSHGILPVAVAGTTVFDVTQIDVSTVLLSRADGVGGAVSPNEGPPGPHSVFDDVATADGLTGCECTDANGDNIADLAMKFRTDDVVAALELDGLAPGALVELVVTGEVDAGSPFTIRGSDCVRLVPPGTPPGLLAVQSSLSDSWIDASPLDLQLDGGGFGSFERTWPLSTLVTFTTEETADGLRFVGWKQGGQFVSTALSIDRTIEGETGMVEAAYARAADLSGDGRLDLIDFAEFAICFGGSFAETNSTCSTESLAASDLDRDGQITLLDFALFASLFGQ